jgi:pimeloyl-ACP methyl ester carboxylesterase
MADTPETSAFNERLAPQVQHVVILVHGIRTDAPWQITLRSELEKNGVRVELTNYGYFDALRFWLPLKRVRETAITRVWTLIRDVRKLYPDANISFLAHSFGTYIVAKILQREFDLKAHRIVFCGSVVRYDFPFYEISERFTPPLVNEVGSADYWPAIAESTTSGYGSSGTYGFREPRVKDRWHNKLNHSQFLTPEFCARFWVPFFVDGTIVEADEVPAVPPLFVRLISRIKIKFALLFIFNVIFFALLTHSILTSDQSSYEAATFDLSGTQYLGRVVWGTVLAAPEFGEQPLTQVRAVVEFPSAGIKLRLFMYRYHRRTVRMEAPSRLRQCNQGILPYCDPPLPIVNASHVIILDFELSKLHKNGNITGIPEFKLETLDRRAIGRLRLIGDSAGEFPEGNNMFVIGLSPDENEEKENLQDLRKFPLFELQMEFADGSRGFMRLPKGANGESAVSTAVGEWLQTTGGD